MWCAFFFLFCLSVPDEFMYNPVTRSYGEPHKRPEVQNATVEFIASSDYMVCVCVYTCISLNEVTDVAGVLTQCHYLFSAPNIPIFGYKYSTDINLKWPWPNPTPPGAKNTQDPQR